MNQTRGIRAIRKAFIGDSVVKGKLWKIWTLQKEMGDLVTQDVEKVEGLSDHFASIFQASVPSSQLLSCRR